MPSVPSGENYQLIINHDGTFSTNKYKTMQMLSSQYELCDDVTESDMGYMRGPCYGRCMPVDMMVQIPDNLAGQSETSGL